MALRLWRYAFQMLLSLGAKALPWTHNARLHPQSENVSHVVNQCQDPSLPNSSEAIPHMPHCFVKTSAEWKDVLDCHERTSSRLTWKDECFNSSSAHPGRIIIWSKYIYFENANISKPKTYSVLSSSKSKVFHFHLSHTKLTWHTTINIKAKIFEILKSSVE